ncbi:MAG: sigma-70 family RNA polymerase sigma factor [Acidobacteriota bacterium]
MRLKPQQVGDLDPSSIHPIYFAPGAALCRNGLGIADAAQQSSRPLGRQRRADRPLPVVAPDHEHPADKTDPVSTDLAVADVERALAGEPKALAQLIDRLTPVIHARVAGLVLSSSAASGSRLRQEVEDLVQEVFVALFADQARVLRSWNPARGMSLRSFVGMVAKRRAVSILRSGKKNPRHEEPTLPEELDRVAIDTAGRRLESRDLLREILWRLKSELSPLGWKLFHWLFVEQRSVGEIGRDAQMSADAIYAWRSRLRRLAVRMRRDIESMAPDAGTREEG